MADSFFHDLDDLEIPEELPVFPLKDLVVVPMAVAPVLVGHASTLRLLESLDSQSQMVAFVTQKDHLERPAEAGDLHKVGCAGIIHQTLRAPDGTFRVVVQGLERIRIREITQNNPWMVAKVEQWPDEVDSGIEADALLRVLRSLFEQVLSLSPGMPDELTSVLRSVDDPRQAAYLVLSSAPFPPEVRQELLEANPLSEKLRRIVYHLQRELSLRELENKLTSDTQEQLSQSQKEYFLREHLKTIQKELGEAGDGDPATVLSEQIAELELPEQSRKEVERELARLESLPTASPEHGMVQTYLEWIASLPWGKFSASPIEVKKAREVLDEDHYDLEEVKDRILEHLAVKKLREERAAARKEAEEAASDDSEKEATEHLSDVEVAQPTVSSSGSSPGTGEIPSSSATVESTDESRQSESPQQNPRSAPEDSSSSGSKKEGSVSAGEERQESEKEADSTPEVGPNPRESGSNTPEPDGMSGPFEAPHSSEAPSKKSEKEHSAPAPSPFPPSPHQHESREPLLCFVGPPGVGKTSLGHSIARAMGRAFVRISLGGVHDEAEIRGHRRTYIGAMPGRIIQALRRSETADPVFMLDEVDKLGMGFHGDPSAALLEVLDPAQNKGFVDTYLGVEFDLSQVLFICTANSTETIPPALLDRMEVIQLAGYTSEEKLHIARRYLLPKQVKAQGLEPHEVELGDGMIRRIIREYTREAGVRNLERAIATVLRKSARKLTEGEPTPIHIDDDRLREFMGPQRYFDEMAERMDRPGVATGVAWTPAGGELLFVEAAVMKGQRERLLLTGMLGDVMRESATAALSWLRSHGSELGIDGDLFSGKVVHVHVPAGAIPKDGPSAGVTIAAALASLASNRPVRSDVAMTGEITLRGKILPVAGIKEKALAAHRAGVERMFLPRRSAGQLEEIPEEVKKELDFELVDSIDELIPKVLQPSSEDSESRRKEAAKKPERSAPAHQAPSSQDGDLPKPPTVH